ncbi:2-C-methyl-D-erythritol 4-phosphate cytidylyltransferase [Hylemonella gracilis]|jgi:2-C-methyl-D-erythritol 4-phosphate cytidylyltransferase|uniref:2-C-methyl-D-erythritol 4-phosphate cytidylyltransferase n=1 Tax=Hylemonella gracilis TaxID=80880 RepID=A0A4P6UMV6_9BURK|nr:2-C-methyl-D-erythritol 4-phosphate cytidylyltransferase [Hylemonella gracilis]QBK05560.1 2-C-methyl-D-erythritol 4-phosphate cytidylyltransferase [Hylemonella gracilis]
MTHIAPQFHVLIPCAGIGSRAGGSLPKQYQPVAGQALVLHTLAAFAEVATVHPALRWVLVVVAPGDTFLRSTPAWSVVPQGGATRADTVARGLAELRVRGAHDADWVLVHDAARCLITPAQIEALMSACANDPVGGLLALPLPDTLKQAEANREPARVQATLDRADKWLAQTPQMFRLGPLAEALAQAQRSGVAVTDEASAFEALGLAPRLVPGSAQNFKVTYPEDFALAEAVLQARKKSA